MTTAAVALLSILRDAAAHTSPLLALSDAALVDICDRAAHYADAILDGEITPALAEQALAHYVHARTLQDVWDGPTSGSRPS